VSSNRDSSLQLGSPYRASLNCAFVDPRAAAGLLGRCELVQGLAFGGHRTDWGESSV